MLAVKNFRCLELPLLFGYDVAKRVITRGCKASPLKKKTESNKNTGWFTFWPKTFKPYGQTIKKNIFRPILLPRFSGILHLQNTYSATTHIVFIQILSNARTNQHTFSVFSPGEKGNKCYLMEGPAVQKSQAKKWQHFVSLFLTCWLDCWPFWFKS